MKVRDSQTFSPDEIQLLLTKQVRLHPTLQAIADDQLLNLERSDKLCRLPSTILDMYHREIFVKLKVFFERCQHQTTVVTSHANNVR